MRLSRFNLNKNKARMLNQNSLLFLLVLLVLASCNKEPQVVIDNPTTYQFTRDGSSTVSFSGQTTRIGMATELINAMKDFSISETTLLEMYANETASGGDANPYSDSELNASTKSVKSKVAASSDFFSSNTAESATIKTEIAFWISSQVNEVGTNQSVLAALGVAGQIADGSSVRYVNGKGLEYNQAVNKSLIGALMVDQISNNYLSTSVLDASANRENNDNSIVEGGKPYTTMEHKWDEAYGYLFGKSANAADPLATLGDDSFLNKYLQRVNNDSDFEGIAEEIFEAFKLGRAAIVAGDYTVRDDQAEIIRAKLAEVIAIRAVYYLQQGKNGIPASGADFGGAFHDLSEGYGFVYSLRFLRLPNANEAYFSRSEVDGFLDLLMAGNGFWEVSGTTLDQISDAIATKFDFTVAQAAN